MTLTSYYNIAILSVLVCASQLLTGRTVQQTSAYVSVPKSSSSSRKSQEILTRYHQSPSLSLGKLYSKAPPGGIDFEVDESELDEQSNDNNNDSSRAPTIGSSIGSETSSTSSSSSDLIGTLKSSSSSASPAINTIEVNPTSSTSSSSTKPQPLPFQNRGKVNEIDFCMSPSDVSLSRSYSTSTSKSSASASVTSTETGSSSSSPRILSLTRALNNASNRAVRRILLSRSWPSAEALNLSLRQVLSSSSSTSSTSAAASAAITTTTNTESTSNDKDKTLNEIGGDENKQDAAKCPVPRPILNIIVRNKNKNDDDSNENENENDPNSDKPITISKMTSSSSTVPNPLSKMKMSDEQWVDEQMKAFRETYGLLPGYEYADAYMQCILSLATSGIESERVMDVIEGGVYDDSYRRLISVLRSAGAIFEGYVDNNNDDSKQDKNNSSISNIGINSKSVPRMKIARKLKDQDICLSMLDKISIRNEEIRGVDSVRNEIVVVENSVINSSLSSRDIATSDSDTSDSTVFEPKNVDEDDDDESVNASIEKGKQEQDTKKGRKGMKDRFSFFITAMKNRKDDVKKDVDLSKQDDKDSTTDESLFKEEESPPDAPVEEEETTIIKPEDLGAVLLSAEEPTVTRQLNVLSNIVKRALLFGGDQELLVLSETLEADKAAFVQRWYPDDNGVSIPSELKDEVRPGVQFFNCLVQLLKDSYTYGVVTDLDPPLPLSSSYENSYERMTVSLVELGSGYIKPINSKKLSNILPKTPKEELVRFSQWETALRQTKSDVTDYPPDLVGSWQVKDEIGGKVIGTSTVVFQPEGEVYVDPPLRGLRWRLDPGPAHLDTCTFQVLNEDGAILQYKGFIDRGARLESRFSKRSIKIRGAVTFQMRDGDTASMGDGYKRDMLPIDTITGTTRFVMNKVFDLISD